jgi:hypothetical protein
MPDTHGAEVKFTPIAENLVYEGLRNPLDVRFFGTPVGAMSRGASLMGVRRAY